MFVSSSGLRGGWPAGGDAPSTRVSAACPPPPNPGIKSQRSSSRVTTADIGAVMKMVRNECVFILVRASMPESRSPRNEVNPARRDPHVNRHRARSRLGNINRRVDFQGRHVQAIFTGRYRSAESTAAPVPRGGYGRGLERSIRSHQVYFDPIQPIEIVAPTGFDDVE